MQAADYSKTEQQLLSKELKEDKELKFSIEKVREYSGLSVKDKLKEEITKLIQQIKNAKDLAQPITEEERRLEKELKLCELRKPVSYPNNYVFALLEDRSYKEKDKVKNQEILHGQAIPGLDNWQLLTVGYNDETRITNGYVGVAYWNPDMQQVIIAHRGTHNVGGAVADIKGVFLNQHVAQIDSAITFTDKIISVLKEVNKEKGSNIELFITGHSLGAWLAPITALSAKYLKKDGDYFVANDDFEKTGYHASTVIFDAPGCEEMLRRIQKSTMNRYIPSSLDIINYLTIPNLINACNPQVGEVYKIFINLSEKEKEDLQKMNIINYTRFTHQIIKIKEVFDPKTGDVLKDEKGKLRIEKIRDWPLLISKDEKEIYRNNIFLYIKEALELVPVVGHAIRTNELYQELKSFFKSANKSNDFHLDGKSTRVKIGENYYRTVRYKTEELDKDYKNRRKLNVFTQSDGQFLKKYKILQEYGDKLPSTFKPEQLFVDFDAELKNKTIKLLRECEVKDGAVYSSNLPEFIPYIKRMLHFFPEMKNAVEKACQDFSADVLLGIYQLASSSYLQSMKNSLNFKRDTFGFKDFLEDSHLKILHTAQSNTFLGALKVYKTFKITENDYYQDKDHAFLNLDRVFYLGEELFISFLKKINHKYLLVIECDDVLNDKMKEFLKDLFKALKENRNIKVILVTERDSKLSSFVKTCNESSRAYQGKSIEARFNDFTSGSQEKLLEKAVTFQGKEVPLSRVVNGSDALDTIIDPETVVELFNDKKIEIGKPLPSLGQTEDYYIDRKLIKKVKVEKGVFKDENLTDLFAVSNVNKEELLKLTNGKRVRNFGEEDPDRSNPIRFITLNKNAEENNFKNLCGVYSDCTIHWLKRENNGDLIWQRSHGKTLFGLRRYIENYESDLSEDKYSADNTSIKLVDVDDISTFDEKFIVVAAEPGMGKTTALTRLGIQRTDDSKWLIRINLVEYKDVLEQEVGFSDVDGIVAFLHKNGDNTLSGTLTKKLLKSRLDNSGNIVLLLDGFDEITSEGQKNVISLLKKLQETKVEKVLISTRLHLRNELENSLSTVAYTFKPFFPGEQKQFLKKFWQKALNANVTQECLDNYINKLLKFVSESIGDKERKFMGIPMQMRMVAEAFQDMTKDRTLLDHPECTFPENFDMVKLYDRFLYAKYLVYFGKRGAENIDLDDEDEDWITIKPTKIHRSLALKVLFPEMEKDFIGEKLLSERDKQRANLVGIAQCINDEIVFTHRTFAEYFVASFLADRLSKNKGSKKYGTTIAFLAKELFESKNEVIKTFLDYRLAKKSVERRIIYAAFRGELDDVKKVLSEGNTDINATDALGRSTLHYAAQEGHYGVVNLLLNNRADIRKPDGLGKTALHYAARYNHGTQVISCLLENVLENVEDYINKKDKNGRNAVYYAAQQGNWDIVKLFIEKGASIDGLKKEDLLFHYIYQNNLKLVKTLIEQGADVIAQDNHGNTLLHIAAQKGHLTIIDFLLEKGADVGIANNSGKRPISYAAESKHWNIVESLLRNNASFNDLSDTQKLLLLDHSVQNAKWDIIKLFMKDNNRDNYFNQLKGQQKVKLLCYVIFVGDLNLVEFLMKKDIEINDFDEYGIRPVYYAARNEYWNIVESLLRRDAKLRDLSDEQKLSLLDYSTQRMHWDVVRLFMADYNMDNYFDHLNDKQKIHCLYYLISVGDLDITIFFIEKLIEKGKISDVNTPNNYGKTFLHLATQDGKLNIAQYLVEEKGANLNAITNCESTPLHLAARNGHLETVKYLVNEKKAGFDVKDKNDSIPLHLAAENGKLEVVKYLIDEASGFKVDNKLHWAARNGYLGIVKLLIEKGADFKSSDENGGTPLHLAVMMGELNVVKFLVEKGANINSPNNNGHIPIILAIGANKVDVVRFLIEKGADFRSIGKDGCTPMHFAAGSDNLDLVELLVEKGADINSPSKNGYTPMLFAITRNRLDVVKFLIEKGADFKFPNEYGCTLMHFVVSTGNGNLNLVKLLIDKGADFKSPNKNGETPLYLAVRKCKLDAIELLMEKVNNLIEYFAKPHDMFLHEAVIASEEAIKTDKLDIVKFLIEKGADFKSPDKDGFTHVHFAAGIGNLDLVKLLVEKGADFKSPDKDGFTPIQYAVAKDKLAVVKFLIEEGADFKSPDKNGLTFMSLAIGNGKLDIVKLLIEKGIDVNEDIDILGFNQKPIHIAAMRGYENIVEFLLSNGASVNDVDALFGLTPLHMAVCCGKSKTVRFLISKGANIDAKDKCGRTSLEVAKKERHTEIVNIINSVKIISESGLASYLVERECSKKYDGKYMHWAVSESEFYVIECLIEKGFSVNLPDKYGETPLHFAATRCNLDMVEFLIEKGANLKSSDKHENTPLHNAASQRDGFNVVKLLIKKGADFKSSNKREETPLHLAAGKSGSLEMVELLIKEGADPRSSDKHGKLPMHFAADYGRLDVVKLFIEIGADFKSPDKDGNTPLHFAARKGALGIVKLLIEKGANINSINKRGDAPLGLAMDYKRQDVIRFFLSPSFSQIQFYKGQQKDYLHLSTFTSGFLQVIMKPVKQGLYLPSFEERGMRINGKCVSITRGLSQALFSQNDKSFLNNLETSSKVYERMAQGKQISKREERRIFALSKLLDTFEQQLESPTSSLPSNLTRIKNYKTLDELSHYLAGMKDGGDFAIHLVTSNHVVAIYKIGDNYAYFDSNTAFVSGLKSVDQLMKVVEKAVKFTGYKLGENGFLVEHFDVNKANSLLSDEDKQVLTKEIKTERQLLAEQDKELGPIKINGQELSRVQLYDFGAKVNIEGSVPLLINADMNLNSEDFLGYLNAGKVNITAREYKEYLDNLGGDKVKEVIQATKIIPFIGSKREIKDAEQTRKLGLDKLLKSSLKQSIILGAKYLFPTFQNISATNSTTTASLTNVSWSEDQAQEITDKTDSRPATHLNGIIASDRLQKSVSF